MQSQIYNIGKSNFCLIVHGYPLRSLLEAFQLRQVHERDLFYFNEISVSKHKNIYIFAYHFVCVYDRNMVYCLLEAF